MGNVKIICRDCAAVPGSLPLFPVSAAYFLAGGEIRLTTSYRLPHQAARIDRAAFLLPGPSGQRQETISRQAGRLSALPSFMKEVL